jgi:hypothetical protein
MAEPLYPVHDRHGRQIGTVRKVHIGRNRATFWNARSLDGCDLGAHPDRFDAEAAIADDWEAGRPRDPDFPSDRWRPILAKTGGPVYLGK